MTTRGPNNIFSGEPLPLVPNFTDPETAAFARNLIDYLRRLTGKLARFSGAGGSTVLEFAAYAQAQSLGVGAGVTAGIPWNVELRKDSLFTHATDSPAVRVSETGLYVVECDVQIFKNFAVDFSVSKTDNGGNIISTPVYAGSHYPAPGVSESVSFMVPIQLSAGDYVSVVMVQDDAFVSAGTRVWITKVKDES